MSSSAMPDNAQDWATFLMDKKLPSPFNVGRLALKSFEREPKSYAAIAQQINADPVLSFYIMDAAQRESGDTTEYSKTLDHAISMIGIDQLKQCIQKVPTETFSKENIQSLYFVKALVKSLYAAHLARRIAEIKSQHNPSDLYWSSLFIHVPLWHLWHYATPEMRLMRFAVNKNNSARVQAQTDMLNCSIEDISEALIVRLGVPPLVKACFQTENQLSARQWVQISQHMKSQGLLVNCIEDREFKMQIQQPAFVVQLASLLSDCALEDWYSKATWRFQKVLAAYLNVSQAEAVQLTHQVAADMSRAHPLPGLLLPAARLFLPAVPRNQAGAKANTNASREASASDAARPAAVKQQPQEGPDARDVKDKKQQLSPETTAPKPKSPATPSAPKPIYSELVTSMYKSPADFTDLHELMNAATSALVYGLGLGRSTISLINKERTRIKAYYSTGCQEHQGLAGFDARLVKGTLFAKLCSKPASVWIKPSSDEKITALVPMNFKQVVGIDDYFLMSVFVNDKPIALVYCDGYPDQGLSEANYKYFKYLCKGLSPALNYLVSAKNRKPPASE